MPGNILTVGDIIPIAQTDDILGIADRKTILSILRSGVDILAHKALWNTTQGWADICVYNRCITLPRGIEAVQAANIGGHPALIQNQWAEFHVNGWGSCDPTHGGGGGGIGGQLIDKGYVPVIQDIVRPAELCALVSQPEDANNPAVTLLVQGRDIYGQPIRTRDANGNLIEGIYVPLIASASGPLPIVNPNAPLIAAVERVIKSESTGIITLVALDSGRPQGYSVLGIYEPDEKFPSYRRYQLSQGLGEVRHITQTQTPTPATAQPPTCYWPPWVRIKFTTHNWRMFYDHDIIPLNSEEAVLAILSSVRARRQKNFQLATQLEQQAVAWLSEKKDIVDGPPSFSFQVPIEICPGGTTDWR